MRGALLVLAVVAVAPPARAQCPDGAPPPCARPVAGPAPNSVAVLPFANLMHDSADAYLAQGLASEISNSLAGVPRLEVRSPALAQRPTGNAAPDPRALGRRLGVRYVVEGDFQRGGDRIRVRVRLITVATGTQRWSNAFTRPVADLLAVQEEIASEVAASIAGQLLPQERAALAVRATSDPAAYDHFLRGNFLLARRTPQDIARAIDEYGQATRLDPGLAQAHARIGLGYALTLERGWAPATATDSLLALGFRSADRALARDSMSADGWMARGYLLAIRDPLEYAGALPAFERAVALDPRNPEVLHQYASKLYELGQFERAIVMERRALTIDPARPVSQLQLGIVFIAQRRLVEALRAYDSAITIDPSYLDGYLNRAQLHAMRGEGSAARADADEALRLSSGSRRSAWAMQAAALAITGDSAAATIAIERALVGDEAGAASRMDRTSCAFGLSMLGRTEEAITLLERLPRGAVSWANLTATFDLLRANPRYQRLLEANRPSGAPR